ELLDVLVELDVEHLEPALRPQFVHDVRGLTLDRPRSGADLLAPEDAVQEDSKAPVAQRVTEKEEVAPAEFRHQRDGDEAGDLGLGKVVDVIVLRDHEALPFALRLSVDLAVDLQDYGA